MRIHSKLFILLCCVYNVTAQHLASDNPMWLAQRSIDYIYHRSLDMIIKDGKTAGKDIGLFYFDKSEEFDTVLITIDPIPDINAFLSEYIPEFDSISFSKLNSDYFPNKDAFNNGSEIAFAHFGETPRLNSNHLMHVIFSPILYAGTRIFLGVICSNQTATTRGIFNYDTYFVFEIEKCSNGIICFRYVYIPWGMDLTNRRAVSKFDIGDRPCQFER